MQPHDEDYAEDYEEERPRDAVIDEAKAAVLDFINEARAEVYYLKQLQVIFEKRFYHWITGKAVGELVNGGKLNDTRVALHPSREASAPATSVRFVYDPRNRYTVRLIRDKLDLIRRFSEEDMGRACGRQAEMLFSRASASPRILGGVREFPDLQGRRVVRDRA